MAEYFGPGVSRTLSALRRNFQSIIWNEKKPPVDSEWNLLSQVYTEDQRQLLSASGHTFSGFLTDPINPKLDYSFDADGSNIFWLGGQDPGDIPLAMVNGWPIPIVKTQWAGDFRSAIKLPPPSPTPSEGDVNFVFLEAWAARIDPYGTTNKPSQGTLYPFGNVEYGDSDLVVNDLIDPRLNLDTSSRVQIQYRIRVIRNVSAPEVYPFGFNPAIRAQGPLTSEVASANPLYNYTNMREELGDTGLWRAGDGNGQTGLMGTVDGFVYAIPIAFVFRRTTGSWGLVSPLHQASTNRNPGMTDRLQARVLPAVTITSDITFSSTSISTNLDVADTTFPASNGLFLLDDEVISYSAWVGTTITVAQRGARRTQPTGHLTGATLRFVPSAPSGLYSDQIVSDDVLDLRHAVQLRGVDHQAILRSNLERILTGESQSTWKRAEGGEKGLIHYQIDYLTQAAPPPTTNGLLEGPAPDGYRKIFSDASTLQPDNLAVFGQAASISTAQWSLNPVGSTVKRVVANQWNTGDILRIPLQTFRTTFKGADNKKVRFVHPLEYISGSSHAPIKVWFGDTDLSSVNPLKNTVFAYTSSLAFTPTQRLFTVLGKKPDGLSSVYQQGTAALLNFTAPDVVEVSGVDFSLPYPGFSDIASYLASVNACFVSGDDTPTTPDPAFHGAWRIIGLSGTGLQLERIDGTVPGFITTSVTKDWFIRLEECTEQDDELLIVLTGVSLTNPLATNVTLNVTYDLLYAPCNGLARNPKNMFFIRVESPDTTYIRELNAPDPSAPITVPDAVTVRDFPVLPLSSFAHRGFVPIDTRRFGRSYSFVSGERTVAEAYVDEGSKSLLFQPLKFTNLEIAPQNLVSAPSWAGDIQVPDFNLSIGAPSVLIPSNVVPPRGRQELPFTQAFNTLPNTPAYGLNFLLQLPGGDNGTALLPNPRLAVPRVLLAYVPGSPVSFGDYVPLSAYGGNAITTPALSIQLYDQNGIRGLELPAHYGVNRVFGIYKASDFYNPPSSGAGAFSSASGYRTLSALNVNNILRRDGEFRSLFITLDNGNFVIPETLIDQGRLSGSFVGEPLILEVSLFLFDEWESPDFLRIYTTNASGPLPTQVSLFTHAAAGNLDSVYGVSSRSPYQGNFTGTQPSSTSTPAVLDPIDYIPKRTLETPAQIEALRQALDLDALRTPNQVGLEILAYQSFALTRGTGVLSGPFVTGSYTDVGYVSNADYPFTSLLDSPRPMLTRAMTPAGYVVGSREPNTERLPLGLAVQDCIFLGEHMSPNTGTYWELTATPGLVGHFNRKDCPTPSVASETLIFSDGTSLGSSSYSGFSAAFNMYRTYRGGCVETNQGSPFALRGGFASKVEPFVGTSVATQKFRGIQGGALFGVAFLVRTRPETATSQNYVTSYGDELQMIILTGASLGLDTRPPTTREVLTLILESHPTGIGEGYFAADRFRLEGRPLERGARETLPGGFKTDTRDNGGVTPPPIPDPCICP